MKTKRTGRANGCGTLERRGAIWRARWVVDGKTFTRSTGTADKREAEKRLAEFVRPFQAGSEAERLEGITAKLQGVRAEIARYEDEQPALSIAEAFEAYRRSTDRPQKAGDDTLSRYEGYLSAFRRWLEANYPDAKELRNVSRAIADEYANKLKESSSPNTFNKHITFFRSLWAVLDETARLGGSNPWAKMKKLTLETHSRRALTVEELTRVCSSVTGEMRLLFALGIYTGLRLGDCALMDWGKVDMVRRMIATVPRKTAKSANGKPVVIPMHGALATMLDEIPKRERKGYVLPDTAKDYLRDKAVVTNRIQRVFTEAGIDIHGDTFKSGRASVLVGFHSLRHTFVSLAGNAGAPLAVVQAIVGHSNPMMTSHYFHENETALQNAVAALPNVQAKIDQPEREDTGEVRFRAFSDALDGLTREQLEAAKVEVERRLAATVNAETMTKTNALIRTVGM